MRKIRLLTKSTFWCFFVKIQIPGILVLLLFGVSANAFNNPMQKLLDRNVTLDADRVQLKKVLRQIEQQTKARFAYSEQSINVDRRVSIHVKKQNLASTLSTLLTPLEIEFREISGRILLTPAEQPGVHDTDVPETAVSDEKVAHIVRGSVKDDQGDPLPGVNVLLKGTQRGTTTDLDGKFELEVENSNSILVFSFVGFLSQEFTIGNLTSLDVTMKEDPKTLEEIVVVGFGEQKKISVTGAVSVISADEIKQTSAASLAVALAGKLPGLTAMQSGGGQPGRDDATLFLRGAATMNTTSPLILIDGVPRDNIRTIDPNEVESISVLKDASATAVFGVRGANGVIIITTKRGSSGKTEFSVTAEQTFTSLTHEPERLHSWEYMRLRNEAMGNDKLPLLYTDEVIEKYINPLAGLDPNAADFEEQKRRREYMYPDHDYFRELFNRHSPQTRINIGARGGTDKINYFINGTYLHQGGNLNTEPKSTLGYDPSSWMDRYSFRSNLDYQMTPFLKSFLNIGAYIEKVNMPAAWLYGNNDTNWMMTDLIYQAQTILPITPGPVTIDGFGVAPGQIVDPGYMDRSAFEIMNRMGYRNEVRSNLNSTFGMELDLGKIVTSGLSIKGMVSFDSRATTAMQGEKRERLFLVNLNTDEDTFSYATKRPDEQLINLVKGADSRYNINLQGAINYNRTFNKHDVGLMFLGQRDYWEGTGGEIPFNVLGVSGRLTYAFNDRYLAEFNMGYNGSEQFSPSRRFGFFPAASVGWIVSNEAFMKSVDWLSLLKLRASYGKVGNDQMGSARFLYLDNITMGGGPLGSLGQGRGVSQGLLGNPDITWEVALKRNFGVDFQLFNDLTVNFDYFVEDRSQILISRGLVPVLQGVPIGNLPRVNMGEVHNKGFEVELTYNKAINSDLLVTIRGNYGMNQNKVIYADEPMRSSEFVEPYTRTGLPLNTNFGYKIDYSNGNGFFNSQEELNQYLSETRYGFGTPRVGDFKYLDLNGDGVIDDKDLTSIGWSRIPGINYGLTLSLNYKGFGVMAFFQGVGRYSQNYAAQGVHEHIIRGTYFGYHKTAWTPERYENGEDITYPALSSMQNTNHVPNDFFIMNKAFTRLRNAEVSYQLPKRLLEGMGVKEFRLYFSGQNLFTWHNLRMNHLDPENTNTIGYPVTKTLNVGVNLTF